ncbi:hypothetical protein [Mycolicibacterium sp.]|uniref:hypothetical protein n=1 Tax=Mycolicibacterium sp. TaxID=2320850 RepID=UPI001D9AD3A8|nr:hypothetical protein [Mycolicibacterium sp.]MCB1288657.1 hypothetical protein [Mycobacterium sp.]MCB9410004.1 hypothetical protein [Mycolicibacterium sp.]
MTADPGLVATLEAERVAVTAAAAMAEDALSLQREALAVLVEGWDGQSGSAAADLLSRQCADGADVVTAMQEVAGELALLRDSLADPGDTAARAVRAYGEAPVGAGVPAAPWGPTGMPFPALPDFGGALAGLVGQITEAIGTGVGGSVGFPAESASGIPAEIPAEVRAGPPEPPEVVPEAVETVPDPVPAPPPDTVPAEAPGPLAAEAPVVSPPTEEPLVIQRPPETEPQPESPAAPATPCEIAADELPQVGR